MSVLPGHSIPPGLGMEQGECHMISELRAAMSFPCHHTNGEATCPFPTPAPSPMGLVASSFPVLSCFCPAPDGPRSQGWAKLAVLPAAG